MIKQQTPLRGLCIDWETTGATFGGDSSILHQGISIGAVVFNVSTFEVVDTMYRMVKFNPKYKWTPEAERIHGLTLEILEEKGLPQEDVAAELAEFILGYFGTSKIMFLGHNPGFDIRFTNQLMQTIGIEFSVERETNADGWIVLHHVVLDTSALGMITMGLFKSDLLFDAVGLEIRGDHNALDDALYTVETCRSIRTLVDFALKG